MMQEVNMNGRTIKVGDRIEIISQWPYMRTPKWARHHKGTVVRFNKLTISVRLDTYPDEICRIDYGDWKIEERDNENS